MTSYNKAFHTHFSMLGKKIMVNYLDTDVSYYIPVRYTVKVIMYESNLLSGKLANFCVDANEFEMYEYYSLSIDPG